MIESSMSLNEYLPSLWKRLQGRGVGAVLARGASGSFAAMVLGAMIAFGTNVFLARVLGVSQYGIYIYALTWINMLALVSTFGMDTSLLRYVAAYKAKVEWGLLRGIIKRSIQYVLLFSVLIAAISAVVIWLLQQHMELGQRNTFWIALFLLPFLGLTGLRNSGLRALKRVILAALPDGLIRPLIIVISTSAIYLYTGQQLQAAEVMIFNLLGAITAFVIGTIWLIKVMPKQVWHAVPTYKSIEWLRVSFPLLLTSSMHLVLIQTDIIMIGIILGAKQAGIYAVCSRISGLVLFAKKAIENIVAPMISEYYSIGNRQSLQRAVTLSARGSFFFALALCIIIAIFGQYVLRIFGEEFTIGYIPLLILIVGQACKALSGTAGFLMSMTEYQNQLAWIISISTLINIVLNVIFISIWGLVGAATATTITAILWTTSLVVFVNQHLLINPTIFAKANKL